MSDIPPDLLEEFRKLERRDAVMDRWFKWGIVALVLIGLAMVFSPCSQAATLDMTDVYCELFEPGLDGRYYIAADPPYTAECPHPWVTLRVDKFKTLLTAYESAGGSSGGSGSVGPFDMTPAEGQLIAETIFIAWGVAYGVKLLLRAAREHFKTVDE